MIRGKPTRCICPTSLPDQAKTRTKQALSGHRGPWLDHHQRNLAIGQNRSRPDKGPFPLLRSGKNRLDTSDKGSPLVKRIFEQNRHCLAITVFDPTLSTISQSSDKQVKIHDRAPTNITANVVKERDEQTHIPSTRPKNIKPLTRGRRGHPSTHPMNIHVRVTISTHQQSWPAKTSLINNHP